MTDYLKPELHGSLIREIQFISEQTHVPEVYIRGVGAKDYCTEEEMVWLRNIKKNIREASSGGMLIHGKQDFPVTKKMMAMGATLIRNFVDARVYPVATLMSLMASFDDDVPDCTVLIIPDLCTEGFQIPPKQINNLYGLLIKRFADNKITIGYAANLDTVSKHYGTSFADFISTHYDLFAVNCTNTSDVSV